MLSETKEPEVNDVENIRDLYEELLQEVIRKDSRNASLSVKVKDVQDVVPAGNNYLSCLHRVFLELSNVNVPPEEKVLILKVFPKGDVFQKLLREFGIFKTEKTMYNKVLPEMNRICLRNLECSTFSAKYFDTSDDNIILLEDLKPAGYKMPDRRLGLDLPHCKLAVKTLARFHGVSVALADASETFLELLPGNPLQKENAEKFIKSFRPQYKDLSEIVESWPGYERFGAKLRDVSLIVEEKFLQMHDPSNTEMAVLNHGDFWLTNMMFKYSETGEIEDIKLVDFQITFMASPAIDLHLFFTTSLNDDVRNEGTNFLLEVYHSEFCRVLEVLGCGHKTVTLEWLKKEMKDKMLMALHTACHRLNTVFAERDEIPDFSEFNDDLASNTQKSVKNKSYCGVKYRQMLQKLLPMFEAEGVL